MLTVGVIRVWQQPQVKIPRKMPTSFFLYKQERLATSLEALISATLSNVS